MTLHRHALSALVLFVGGALLTPGEAEAGMVLTKSKESGGFKTFEYKRLASASGADDSAIDSVTATVSSDAGKEDLVFTESDAWLHGSAALSALPAKDAALTLTLYDKGSASLITFSGTLATDGAVTLAADETTSGCEVRTKLGCTVVEAYDVEILAAEVFASGKGYLLTLDLAGADTYEVAYATVAVSGGDKVEVDWAAVGSVWEAESTLEHTGPIDVKAKARDANGDVVENVSTELAEPWQDDGEGVNALSAGSGTSVAVHRVGPLLCKDGACVPADYMTGVSDGWTTTSYPTHAELEVGGETVTAAAILMRMRKRPELLYQAWDETYSEYITGLVDNPGSTLTISSGSFLVEGLSAADLSSPVCSSGTCVVLVEAEKGYELSFTTYGENAAKLPDKQALSVVFYDKSGTKVESGTLSVEFDTDVTAVFAVALEIDGDPVGSDASGSLSLLGAADTKGKQDTLSKGSFYAGFSRDSDGDLGLGGYGADEWATSETSASAVLGDPVECSGDGCDGDWAPPVIVYSVSGTGGKVTKIVVSSGGLGYDAF